MPDAAIPTSPPPPEAPPAAAGPSPPLMPPAPRARRRRTAWVCMVLGAGAALLAWAAWRDLERWAARPQGPPVSVDVTIRPGMGARAIARLLHERGLIDAPRRWLLWLAIHGRGRGLQAGRYAIRGPLSPAALADTLRRGRFERALTIPEGWTARQIARRLAQEGWIPDERQWLELVARPLPAGVLGPEPVPEGAEGFCFPDTYRFDEGADAEAILGRMLAEFRRQWQAARPDVRDPRAAALSMREVVTLASMIEREARDPAEMPSIASVYLNRLQRRMKLQCCATVHYALGEVWNRALTLADLEIDSPYNTYRHAGLPPGPIANPGRTAIEAVLRPADEPYLFYVYDGAGRHRFSRTYAEHLQAIQAVRRRDPQAAAVAQTAD